MNVLYLNTLPTDAMKQAFIQQLCRKLYDWMLANPSPDRLQCVLFIDEAGPFMPPDPRSPPAKEGLRLLLQAGVGSTAWAAWWPARARATSTTGPSVRPARCSWGDSPRSRRYPRLTR